MTLREGQQKMRPAGRIFCQNIMVVPKVSFT